MLGATVDATVRQLNAISARHGAAPPHNVRDSALAFQEAGGTRQGSRTRQDARSLRRR